MYSDVIKSGTYTDYSHSEGSAYLIALVCWERLCAIEGHARLRT